MKHLFTLRLIALAFTAVAQQTPTSGQTIGIDTVTYSGEAAGLSQYASINGHKFGYYWPTDASKEPDLGQLIFQLLRMAEIKDCPEGSYFISITVDRMGNVSEVLPLKADTNTECWKTIKLLILNTSGKWIPAQKGGQNVTNKFVFKW